MMLKLAKKPIVTAGVKVIVYVACIYAILPLAAVFLGTSIVALCATVIHGVRFYYDPTFYEYLRRIGAFFGELTLLLGSGLVAINVSSRPKGLEMFGFDRASKELLIGTSVGVVSYYFAKRLLLPWLYLAMPVGSDWIKSDFYSLGSYHVLEMSQLGGTFFLNAFYSPLVETIVFVGLMYRTFRSQWGTSTSLLLGATVFAAAHQSESLFLDFFVLGLTNFALYEFRKSLGASVAHHVTFNVLVYGSQLLLLKGS